MASYQENEPFDMDQLPFDMEDDYGFYEDLEEDYLPQPSSDEDTLSHSYGRIEDELTKSLQSSPPILSTDIVEQIVEDGLPWAVQEMKWDRLFSSSRDGTNFGTFMRKTRGHAQTIVVAKSSNGKIVGAYATEPWSGKKLSNNNNSRHGFIFSASPAKRGAMSPLAHPSSHSSFGSYIPGLEDLGTSPTSAFHFDFDTKSSASSKGKGAQVDILKSRTNAGLKQVCQISNKLISLGDGENLNLSIEGCFSRGSASSQQADREEFRVVGFEVYGFSDS
mmetsp:Transcript_22218/g.45288  ORF Transcript_22218/g.45288 Transcript_22218/m.45288 type:complete len:277 (-) Transcript_22218:141-971(-)